MEWFKQNNNIDMKIENALRLLGEKFKGIVSTPIVVGGWAINFLGYPRQTIDFDFMILEDESEKAEVALREIGFVQTIKTNMYTRFENISSKDGNLPYLDCLFADRNTYDKIAASGKNIDIFGTTFILPCPMHIIAMKFHAIKYSTGSRNKDFEDIMNLIRMYNIDTSKNSELEAICKKYGNEKILKDIRNND